ncbi:uncharacterized protein PHACADRAFT_265689 [Phanerochaete carnosa HHB-10118-sp]|uniref:Uncharacterized protein n=1 Tax=Phanerochaete carnosa (strain HHB-10118-sp) TaxID=650164 RepID=K5VS03_PHACS|nr:uncharacterized protein PHACADRAFT_265689 [Phanerochaete carnosa HHB-10118-sp]EKM49324.1 hypothetical protein PHACADRAFT_265689 [Phanerochaete carnosa HHB-10118-sp]
MCAPESQPHNTFPTNNLSHPIGVPRPEPGCLANSARRFKAGCGNLHTAARAALFGELLEWYYAKGETYLGMYSTAILKNKAA